MEYKPHDYQQFAINYILEHPIAAVILGMGLGKTSITLTAIEQLIYDSFEVSKVLVVAPLRVARNTWSDEIHKWNHLKHLRYSIVLGSAAERKKALEADADIYIINRENLQWLIEQSGVNFFWDMVVLDELSSFKNWNSKRFKAFMKVRPKVKRVIGLTMDSSHYNNSKRNKQAVRDAYGAEIRIFDQTIPRTEALAETASEGVSIFSYYAKGKGAYSYQALVQEVLNHA